MMPLRQPINYMIDVPDPTDAIQKNLQFATGLMGVQQGMVRAQQQQQVFDQAQQKHADEQAFKEAFSALSLNPTAADVVALTRRFPSQSGVLKAEWDKLEQSERKARVGPLSNAYAAFLNNAPKIALDSLETLKTAYANTPGRERDAAGLSKIIDLGKSNPGAAAALIASNLAVEGDPDKFVETFSKFTTLADEKRQGAAAADKAASDATTAAAQADYAARQQAATLAQTNAATDSSRATAESARASAAEARSKISQLPESVQKDYTAAVKGIQEDRSKVSDMGDLAKELEGLAGEGRWVDKGAPGWFNEQLKDVAGWQNKLSRINQKYLAAVSADIKAKARPGDQMTDADLKVAMQAYPSVNSNPVLKAQTIRDLEQDRKAGLVMKLTTAGFLQKNGSFNPATKAFTVQGVNVKPGDTFDSVVQAVAAKSGSPVPAATRAASSVANMTAEQLDAREAELTRGAR